MEALGDPLVALAAVAAVLVPLLVWANANKTRRDYSSAGSVAVEYDAWTSDGVLEHFWGEHIHHGYYPGGNTAGVDFKKSKVDMNKRILEWAGIPSGAHPGGVVRVLDVGCGIGGSARFLARHFGGTREAVRVDAVTLSPAQQSRAQELNEEQGLGEVVHVQVADALALPFGDATFDLVWSMESAEHMPDKAAFIAEVSRVMKPGGHFVMATWCHRSEEERALSTDERARLQRVYREWALPHFIPIEQYATMAPDVGLTEVHAADWTREAAPTWPHAVREGARGLLWLLSRGPRVFWRTLRDVFAIYHMVQGYNEGTIRYGVFAARRGWVSAIGTPIPTRKRPARRSTPRARSRSGSPAPQPAQRSTTPAPQPSSRKTSARKSRRASPKGRRG